MANKKKIIQKNNKESDERLELLQRIKDLEEMQRYHMNSIQIGDISIISSNASLNKCRKMAEGILKSKQIRQYLDLVKKQKIIGMGNYT